jgi:predicted site-specific integrase-resolvase
MKELTIEQVMDILDIARPTAYNLARKFGRLDETIPPNGKYFLPSDRVFDIIREERKGALAKEHRFYNVLANGKT